MTSLADPPAGAAAGGGAPAAAADGAGANGAAAPALASGVEFLGDLENSGYRRKPALVRRADGQTIQVTPLLYRLLGLVDGRRTYHELAEALGERVGKSARADDVRFLLEEKVRPLGLLREADGTEPEVEKPNALLALRFKYIVSNQRVTGRLAALLSWLFNPALVAVVALGFVVLVWWIAFEKGLASAARQALYEPEFLLLALVLTLVSAGFHELGHAAACRYSGASPGAMGVGLYLVWPAFYTDVSDSYRLPRGGRLRVDLGGLYFNAIFALGVFGVWAAQGSDALLLVIAAQLVVMARQLIPIVRFDGYHILADLTGVPDLFRHIKPTLLEFLPWRREREEAVLKPWARGIVTTWVVLVVPLLLGLLALALLIFPRIAATAWDSIGNQAQTIGDGWRAGNPVGVALGAISIVGVALPVAGIAYVAVRIARRAALGTWRATEGNPPLRATALVAAAALLGFGTWAWWPRDQYRPIQATETWTLAATTAPLAREMTATSDPTTRRDPTAASGSTAAGDSASAPSSSDGEWMLVLVSPEVAAEAAAPELAPSGVDESWPFPFAPPPAAGEGDNQASAVNTEDGSTQFASALALVWVENGDVVDNENAAYALASCTACTTTAVAFQVVLIVGYSPIVTPENVAVAVNYECAECATTALALQLVATLTSPPSADTRAQIEAIWSELEAAGEDFALLPLSEVYAAIDATREAILAVIARDEAAAPPQLDSDDATGSDEPGSDETGEADVADDTAPPSDATTTAPDEGDTATTTTDPTTTDPATTETVSGSGSSP